MIPVAKVCFSANKCRAKLICFVKSSSILFIKFHIFHIIIAIMGMFKKEIQVNSIRKKNSPNDITIMEMLPFGVLVPFFLT